MNWNYQDLLPADFSPASRVWIYQSNRVFAMSEALQIESALEEFTASWKSHGAAVKAYGNLFFGQFIVLIADETAATVGGCSTDSSVRMIKELEQRFSVNLFDRQLLAFLVKEKVQVLPLNQLQYAIDNGFIQPDTLYFNNLVATFNELKNAWMIPVKDSWLARRINWEKQSA
jgi:hypothetical protein